MFRFEALLDIPHNISIYTMIIIYKSIWWRVYKTTKVNTEAKRLGKKLINAIKIIIKRWK